MAARSKPQELTIRNNVTSMTRRQNIPCCEKNIDYTRCTQMKALAFATAGILIASTAAFAQTSGKSELMTSIPASGRTVTDWYKQNVYDPKDQKIGEIMDVLVNPSGQVDAAIVGVGGFLGAGEKDVAVSFNSIKATKKNDKTYLTLDTTKDALKNAPGFKYGRNTTTWVPDNQANKSSSR